MNTFVFGDIHGRYESLVALLRAAEILDENYERISDDLVVSIGDLANVVRSDISGDKQCLQLLVERKIDLSIIGNHEAGLIFPSMSFNGFHRDPEIQQVYNHLERSGLLKPCLLVGDTLLTHAGIHKFFDFKSSMEANDAIMDVYENWSSLNNNNEERFYFEKQIEIPKYMILDAVSGKRGGSYPMGGILWADWDEPKNNSFSQIFGHTPTSKGPIETHWMGTGVTHWNIDTAAKKGLMPCGLWLDEEGVVRSVIQDVPVASTY